MAVYYDIETAPMSEETLKRSMPEFKPRGNIVKEETAKKDVERQQAQYLADAALYPTTGWVCAFGWAVDDNDAEILTIGDYADEPNLLGVVWSQLADARGVIVQDLIGHNSNAFDMPYLIRRSLIRGVRIPQGLRVFRGGRVYLNDFCKDTLMAWACGTKDMTSLAVLARVLGLGDKDGDFGAKFYANYLSDPAKAKEYLKNDVELTRKIARRLGL